MKGARCEIGDHAVWAEHSALDRLVIGEHGHDRVASACLGDAQSRFCAARDQRFGLRWRSIEDGHAMTGLQQIGCHASAHVAQTNEAHMNYLAFG